MGARRRRERPGQNRGVRGEPAAAPLLSVCLTLFAAGQVFVDAIARLNVLTSTRVVNVGDTETLDVQAFDAIGNVFSSLVGAARSFGGVWWWERANRVSAQVSRSNGPTAVAIG